VKYQADQMPADFFAAAATVVPESTQDDQSIETKKTRLVGSGEGTVQLHSSLLLMIRLLLAPIVRCHSKPMLQDLVVIRVGFRLKPGVPVIRQGWCPPADLGLYPPPG